MLDKGMFALSDTLHWESYKAVFDAHILRYAWNSIRITAISLLLIIFLGACAAYPLARFSLKGKNTVRNILIWAVAVPIQMTLIPLFRMTKAAGLYDSIWALIGPYVGLSLPMSILIMTEFMRTIPKEIEDSAYLDGCGLYRTFFRLILPLCKPCMGPLVLHHGLLIWNEFLIAFTLTHSASNRPISTAVWDLQQNFMMNTPVIMAGLTVTLLPMLLVYVVVRKNFEKGIMVAGLKG